MAGALKPDLCSPEPLPEADLLCGRAAVSAASPSTDIKAFQGENDGKETSWATQVQLVDILA